MENPALNNKRNNTDNEFGQLKEYSKPKIKNESTRKIKKIKKEMDTNDGT
jgi:hypothetical protein